MSNRKPDYVPSPEHAAAKLAKFERWQATLAGMIPASAPVGLTRPRSLSDRRDFVPADPIPGDKYAAQRGSLRAEAAKLAEQADAIRKAPTERRRRWEEAKARAVEMAKDKALLSGLTVEQVSQIKLAAEAEYPADLAKRDEADKALRIARLTQPVG